MRRVKVGDEATAVFSAYPDEHFVGKVFSVADLLDLDTRSVKVRVAMDNPDGRFKPGMFATVRFTGTYTARVPPCRRPSSRADCGMKAPGRAILAGRGVLYR